jgi:hypothetical protein
MPGYFRRFNIFGRPVAVVLAVESTDTPAPAALHAEPIIKYLRLLFCGINRTATTLLRDLAVSFVFQLGMVWRWGFAKNVTPHAA